MISAIRGESADRRGDAPRARAGRLRTAGRWLWRAAAAAARWVRSAPATYCWLLILGATTIVLVHLSPRMADRFLRQQSTNLVQLGRHPLYVLIASAFWTERPSWGLYLVLFTALVAPVERWLGTWRWLAVVAAGHVGATLLSETHLAVAINLGLARGAAADTVDVGVSYGIAACAGVLTYRVPSPWRYPYLAAALAYVVAMVLVSGTFTDYGHLDALLIGLAMWPVTRARGGAGGGRHGGARVRSRTRGRGSGSGADTGRTGDTASADVPSDGRAQWWKLTGGGPGRGVTGSA